ncbi:IS5/IS1182 family transposase, partial [Streptomyces anulatus]
RARVEHTFARMKNWKILRDCRQKGDGLHHAVATMHNLAKTG